MCHYVSRGTLIKGGLNWAEGHDIEKIVSTAALHDIGHKSVSSTISINSILDSTSIEMTRDMLRDNVTIIKLKLHQKYHQSGISNQNQYDYTNHRRHYIKIIIK